MTGTSMATPHVAGVLGLMRSIAPNKTIEELRSVLRASADDLGAAGWDIYYGAGRLNAYKALQQINAITSVSLRGPYTVKPGVAATYHCPGEPFQCWHTHHLYLDCHRPNPADCHHQQHHQPDYLYLDDARVENGAR
jgi:hypothetical protein